MIPDTVHIAHYAHPSVAGEPIPSTAWLYAVPRVLRTGLPASHIASTNLGQRHGHRPTRAAPVQQNAEKKTTTWRMRRRLIPCSRHRAPLSQPNHTQSHISEAPIATRFTPLCTTTIFLKTMALLLRGARRRARRENQSGTSDLDERPPEDMYNQQQPASSVLLNPFTPRLTRYRRYRHLQDEYDRLMGACCTHSTFQRMVGKISCRGLGRRFRAT